MDDTRYDYQGNPINLTAQKKPPSNIRYDYQGNPIGQNTLGTLSNQPGFTSIEGQPTGVHIQPLSEEEQNTLHHEKIKEYNKQLGNHALASALPVAGSFLGPEGAGLGAAISGLLRSYNPEQFGEPPQSVGGALADVGGNVAGAAAGEAASPYIAGALGKLGTKVLSFFPSVRQSVQTNIEKGMSDIGSQEIPQEMKDATLDYLKNASKSFQGHPFADRIFRYAQHGGSFIIPYELLHGEFGATAKTIGGMAGVQLTDSALGKIVSNPSAASALIEATNRSWTDPAHGFLSKAVLMGLKGTQLEVNTEDGKKQATVQEDGTLKVNPE